MLSDRRGLCFIAILLSIGVQASQSQWERVDRPSGSYVKALAFCGTRVFAGGAGGGGVWLSTNNGRRWTPVDSGLKHKDVSSLAAHGTKLFAGTYDGGVFRSTDNGGSWTAVDSGLSTKLVLSLAASELGVFAGTDSGVFLSTNDGASWGGQV